MTATGVQLELRDLDGGQHLAVAAVGCYRARGLTETGLHICADCHGPITGHWLSDIPLPGERAERGDTELRYWHTGSSACAQAAG